ncbi:hypothetical protein MMC32_006839 [Xylographa parallela]|nr:hypothetical protein [Xylographa parallela]
MDCHEELERLALNAEEEPPSLDHEPSAEEIARWVHLFHYSPSTATSLIQQQRNGPTRTKVSNAHWTAVHARWEATGYDHLAYEHELALSSTAPPKPSHPPAPPPSAPDADPTFLVHLSGPLSTPSQIQSAANLPTPPTILHGASEDASATFCTIDTPTRQALESWLAHAHPAFRPTFIRYSAAAKDLSPTSVHPTLGIDATLPQHRLGDCAPEPLPRQDQYPVWYFFYGTLCDAGVLAAQLGVREDTRLVLHDATVRGGVLKIWGGKYKALVDGPEVGGGVVEGKAYAVRSGEEEEALRVYETGAYEVVRCGIGLRGGGGVGEGVYVPV